MKMAKASEADLNMAMELTNAFDALTQRWGATVPEGCEKLKGDDEREVLDLDDPVQCRRVLEYLIDLAGSASLMRVVFGMAVLLDPLNKMVDAKADTLEHHPRVETMLQALRHIEGAAMDTTCERVSLGDAARNAIASAT